MKRTSKSKGTHRSFQFFDLVLSGPSPHFLEFSLSSDSNARRDSILEIQQVELYDTIRIFPSEIVIESLK